MSTPQQPRRPYLLGVNDKRLLKRMRIAQDDVTTRSSTDAPSTKDTPGAGEQ
jgi:hypothetical protein